MSVIGTVFDPQSVTKAVERGNSELDGGISCIVDWQNACTESHDWFKRIADEVGGLFGPCFDVHQRLHSTVLSIKLDGEDLRAIPEPSRTRVRERIWRDPKYSRCQWMFRELLKMDQQEECDLTFTLDGAVIAQAGTVQLVLRNEDQLPAMRGYMVSQGAQVKPGTIDGDFIYTCTVVLGQVTDADEAEKRLPDVRSYLSKLEEGKRFSTTEFTIMKYRDFGLVDCELVKRLPLVQERNQPESLTSANTAACDDE